MSNENEKYVHKTFAARPDSLKLWLQTLNRAQQNCLEFNFYL